MAKGRTGGRIGARGTTVEGVVAAGEGAPNAVHLAGAEALVMAPFGETVRLARAATLIYTDFDIQSESIKLM